MENNDTTPAPIGPSKRSHDALKAVMLVVLFFATFLASTASLPLRNFVLAHAHSSPRVGPLFSLVSCFGAGVFLATCLLDMLPDAQKSMAQAEQRLWPGGSSTHFPLCAFFIAVGFLLVLLLEQIAHCVLDWLGGGVALFGHHRHQAVPAQQHLQQQQRRNSQQQHQPLLPTMLDNGEDSDASSLAPSTTARQDRQQQQQQQSSQPLAGTDVAVEHGDEEQQHQQQEHQLGQQHHEQQQEHRRDHGEEEEEHGSSTDFDAQLSTMRVFLLLFALMLHACCEGISIGTFTDVSVLFQIFIALFIHKSIVGFSLGLRLVQSSLRPIVVVLCCALFSLQVLIGGFLSLAVMDMLDGKLSMFMLSAISQAIACGTFLYITTMEILPHELSPSSASFADSRQHAPATSTTPPPTTTNVQRGQKVGVLLAGFTLISTFVAVFPDADDGGS